MKDPGHDSDTADLVARVVEEYFERLRCGEHPDLDQFVQQYPAISDLLRTVIPGLQVADRSANASSDAMSAYKSLGDFNILREIGRGGMGIVYEAEQVSLGRRVALKVLLHHASASSRQRSRFQREARSAARLHHTNIVPVFGVGEEGDTDYYVMQLIQGRGLDEVLVELRHLRSAAARRKSEDDAANASWESRATSLIAHSLRHGDFSKMPSSEPHQQVAAPARRREGDPVVRPHARTEDSKSRSGRRTIVRHLRESSTADSSVSPTLSDSHLSIAGLDSTARDSRRSHYCDSVARIGLQVASALQYAHDHSVLHRDIKPSNLILDSSGTVWVSDFGLAKVMDQQELTNTGDVLGTLRYMPPEAFRGRADQRSDIYSLGITLYEMLALRPAFDEADRHLLISLVAEGSLERLERVDPSIPRDLVTIVHKAIEPDPADRYQSAKEMEDDFASFLADEPIKARRISSIERITRWSRRNRGMTAALMSIAAMLVVGTVASMMWAMHSAKLRAEAERNRDLAEYNQYVSDILATNYRTEKDTRSAVVAQNTLAATPAKYRNWEWAALANKVWQTRARDAKPSVAERRASRSADFWAQGVPEVHSEIVPQHDNGTGILTGEYNTEGTALVLTLGNGSAALYPLTTDGAIARLKRRDSTFYHMTSNFDDSRLVTSVCSGPAIIYDAATLKPVTVSPEECVINQATWVWAPNPGYVVSLHPDSTIRIWDASTLDPSRVVVLRGNDPNANWLETSDIRFTENGNELWSAAMDGTISKWSFPDGKLLDTIEAPIVEGMTYHGMSPDGQTAVATLENGASFLWNINWHAPTSDYLPLAEKHLQAVSMRRTPAAFSPDGTCVAVMDDLFTASIYDVAERSRLCTIEGHSAEMRSVQFSPSGDKLLTVSEDGTAKIWTCRPVPDRDRPTFATAHRDLVFQIDFDPPGKRLLSGSFDGTARVWDLETRSLIATYDDHHAPVVAVDFNAHGTRAASLDAKGVLHVWDPVTGRPIFHIDPQSDQFASHLRAGSGTIKGDLLYFPGVLSTGLFTPDGDHVVTFQEEAMKVFRAVDGMFEVSLVDSSDHGWPVFNHDSSLVAILEMNARDARVWNLRTGRQVTASSLAARHSRALTMVAFSPVDDKLASGGMGGEILVRNARTGELIHPPLRPEFGLVDSCRFSSDGRLVLASYSNGLCRVSDADSGDVVTTLTGGHLAGIRDLRISPDGTRLLSWSVDDHAIVWDLARPSANQLVVLGGKSRLIQAQWSPDGRDIITAWSDGSIGVWSGATQKDLASLVHETGEFGTSFNAWRDQLATKRRQPHD